MKKGKYLLPLVLALIGAAGLPPIDGDPIFSPHLTTPLVQAAARVQSDATMDSDERLTPLYWMAHQQDGDDVIFTAPQVRLQNAIMRNKTNELCDLTQEPGYLTYWRLTYMLRNFTRAEFPTRIAPALYNGMQPVAQEDFVKALDNENLAAVTTANFIRYGVVVNRTDVRRLPTAATWSRMRGDVMHDRLQLTALDPATPVAVLHTSSDGQYLFVQGRDVLGWVKTSDVALTDKDMWMQYVNPSQNVAVVTAKNKILVDQGQYRLFQMGATIPLETYQSRLYMMMPSRDKDGNLEVHRLRTGWDETIRQGYLPYTRNNVIRQSFKFLGAKYRAGDSWDGVDDAGMAYAVYRTMGLRLPRVAEAQQEVLPIKADFDASDTAAERQHVLRATPAGTLLFVTPSQVLIYLGEDSQGQPYAIHNADTHYALDYDKQKREAGVVVSNLAKTPDGEQSLLQQLTSLGSFYQNDNQQNAPQVVKSEEKK